MYIQACCNDNVRACILSLREPRLSRSGVGPLRSREKLYDNVTAVGDLSLEVADGELMVLVGPSGCGKTTALRMVAGLEEITDGRDLDRRHDRQRPRPAPARRRDGLPELRALPAHDRVRQHRLRPAGAQDRRRPRSAGASRARAAALGLSELLERKPRQLSGGQRQRVAMGRAIVREPSVFLMDEPLSNLDATPARPDARRGRAHAARARGDDDLRHARPGRGDDDGGPDRRHARAACCSRPAIPQDVYDRPANLFVASFIGSPPMNLVQARLDRATATASSRSSATRSSSFRPKSSRERPGLSRYVGRDGRPRHPARARPRPAHAATAGGRACAASAGDGSARLGVPRSPRGGSRAGAHRGGARGRSRRRRGRARTAGVRGAEQQRSC